MLASVCLYAPAKVACRRRHSVAAGLLRFSFTFFIFLWVLFLLLISFAIGLTFFRMEWTTVKLLRNFTFTNNYNSHTANTCSMLIGGFEIYGGE